MRGCCLGAPRLHDTFRQTAFDKEIEKAATVGSPTLIIEQRIEEGNCVIALGRGEVSKQDGTPLSFVFSDVFTFTDDRINHLETYQVNPS